MAFIFKEISAETFGLKVTLLQSPQRAESRTEIITIPGRPEPLIKSHDEFSNFEITFEAIVTDTSRIRDIFAWLRGEGKLVYDDEPDKFYYAISNQLISVTRISDEIRSFQIKFICRPFAMALTNPTDTFVCNLDTEETITGTTKFYTMTLDVGGSYPCEPLWCIKFAGRLEIGVNGALSLSDKLILDTRKSDTEGEGYSTFLFDPYADIDKRVYKYFPPSVTLYIDTSLRIAYTLNGTTKQIHNELTAGIFPLLPVGINEITFAVNDNISFKHENRNYRYVCCKLDTIKITKNERWL